MYGAIPSSSNVHFTSMKSVKAVDEATNPESVKEYKKLVS